MNSIEEIFAEYVFAERQGDGDPRPFLRRLEGADRERLGDLIDAYLATSPGKEWDPQAFQDSAAARAAESIGRALSGVSGTWPVVLPSLRERAQLKRSELTARLAKGLGFPEQQEAVGDYYHGMEYGTLEASGVSDRVLDALGQILGAGKESLRRSGEQLGGGQPAEGSVFAREVIALASPSLEARLEDAGNVEADRSSTHLDPDREAVDRLFTEGP